MLKESELLEYVENGHLSLEKRYEYLSKLGVIKYINGHVFVCVDANGVKRGLTAKGESKPLYEITNEEIDRIMYRISKQREKQKLGNMGIDINEVEKVVNKHEPTISPDEIPF